MFFSLLKPTAFIARPIQTKRFCANRLQKRQTTIVREMLSPGKPTPACRIRWKKSPSRYWSSIFTTDPGWKITAGI